MKYNLKQITINLILLLAIFLVLGSFYLGFIAGPKRAYEEEDRLIVEAMMQQEGYTQASILNRFAFDKVYYITEVELDGSPHIAWFDKELSKVVVDEYVSLDRMFDIADQYAIAHDKIAYGVYEDQLVYVLKTKEFEAFFRASDLQIVYHLGSDF